MPLRYVLFKEDNNTHEEIYLTRVRRGFAIVKTPEDTNLTFGSAVDGYKFCGNNEKLQYWRVGRR